ncbi:MAG: amidase domain-containing protein [Solirubrobacterales bacterium]|nr:amidase domain-containing protein [Solirubrobacterales bacterium]
MSVTGVGSALASGGGVVGWSPVRIDSGLFESARLALASESGGEGAASGGGSVGVGLSDAAALSLAKREFADALVAPVWSAPLLGEGARIAGFASDSTAVVVDGDKRTLLSSLLPLRSPDGDGAGIVSTGLDETSGGFEPANALTSITVGDEAGVAASFARAGVSVSPLGGATGADGVRLGSDKVFYANTARDTDFVVAALPAGAETFSILRSEESPAEQGLKVGLPAGATLERSPDGAGVSIVKDGRVMAQVSPASAVDANGNNVPVSESVVGDTVRISVDRSGDVAYPILVDPTITLSQTYWDTTGSTVSLAGWSWKTTNPNGFLSSTNGGWGRGLYSMVKAQPLASGDSGEWRYTAPGDSKVTLAQLHHVTRVPNTANGFKPICTSQGILNPLNGWEPGLTTTVKANDTSGPVLVSSPRTVCQNASSKETAYFSLPAGGGSAGNSVVNTQWAYGAGTRTALTGDPFGISEYDMIGGAYLQIQDDKQPTAEATTGADWPTGWTNHYEGDITVGANDTGTGIWKVNLAGDPSSTGTNSANQEQGIYCDGTQTIPCPASWNTTNQWAYTKTFHINTDNLPEGDNTLTLTTTDRTGNTSTPQQIHIKIDRTAPTVGMSGELASQTDGSEPLPALELTATDARSGVSYAELLVDGMDNDPENQRVNPEPCAVLTCELNELIHVDAASLADGLHTLTLKVRDGVGNEWSRSWAREIATDSYQGEDLSRGSAPCLSEGQSSAGAMRLASPTSPSSSLSPPVAWYDLLTAAGMGQPVSTGQPVPSLAAVSGGLQARGTSSFESLDRHLVIQGNGLGEPSIGFGEGDHQVCLVLSTSAAGPSSPFAVAAHTAVAASDGGAVGLAVGVNSDQSVLGLIVADATAGVSAELTVARQEWQTLVQETGDSVKVESTSDGLTALPVTDASFNSLDAVDSSGIRYSVQMSLNNGKLRFAVANGAAPAYPLVYRVQVVSSQTGLTAGSTSYPPALDTDRMISWANQYTAYHDGADNDPHSVKYPYLDGKDCANFASQTLRRGKIPFLNVDTDPAALNAWWLIHNPELSDAGYLGIEWSFSNSWSAANNLYNFLWRSGWARPVGGAYRPGHYPSAGQLQDGDLIFMHRPAMRNAPTVKDHVGVVGAGRFPKSGPVAQRHLVMGYYSHNITRNRSWTSERNGPALGDGATIWVMRFRRFQ